VRPLDDDLALCDLDWRIRSQDDVTVARAKVTAVWRRRAAEPAEPDRPEERADEKVFSELYL
jgi:hypothetical protein